MSYSNDINPHLQNEMLPPALYIKGFVNNETRCNYEYYLMEVINNSDFFQKLSKGEAYRPPISESHGECDAFSENYQMDFKLAEGNSKLEAKNLLEAGITKLANGVTAWHTSKKRGKTTALNINKMLENLKSTDDIRTILSSEAKHIKFGERTEDNIDQQGLYEIKLLAMNLLIKKNLLFYFPEVFSFVDGITYSFDEATIIIGKAIEHDFSVAFDYRNQENPGYDTYFCCVYDDYFLFFSYKDKQLNLIDCVKCSSCDTYKYLREHYGERF